MNFINKLKIVAGLKLDKTNETNEKIIELIKKRKFS